MDVDYSVHEQNHTSCKTIRLKADKIEPKNSINVKKAKKPVEKHRKTSLPLRDKGRKTILIFLRQSIYTVKQKVNKKSNKVKLYTIYKYICNIQKAVNIIKQQ